MSVITRCVDGVCVCALPNEQNDFRPLALRHRSLAFVSALLIAAKVLALGLVALTPTTAELSTITAARIVQLTNAERTSRGLAALTVNDALTKAAQDKAQDMLNKDYFAHISPSGVTPWFWMAKHGYLYQVAGENLAIDFTEAEDVVAAWIASPSHKDNMLHTAYTETGVAAATGEFQGGTSTVVVHMFGLPAAPSAATVSTPTPAPATTPNPTVAPETTTQPVPSPEPVPGPDATPPRTPRIALLQPTAAVQDAVTVAVSGDIGSTVHLQVNNTDQDTLTLSATEIHHQLSLAGLADGSLVLQAYAVDDSGNRSNLSERLRLVKDTTGPELTSDAFAVVLGPATDSGTALLKIGNVQAERITLTQGARTNTITPGGSATISLTGEPVTLTLTDRAGNTSGPHELSAKPVFAAEHDTSFTAPSQRFTRQFRYLAAVVFLLILILLSLAVMVRFSVQRPALIAHSFLVLILAAALLFL